MKKSEKTLSRDQIKPIRGDTHKKSDFFSGRTTKDLTPLH